MLSYMGLNVVRAQRPKPDLDRSDRGHSAVFKRVELIAALGAREKIAKRTLADLDLCKEDDIKSKIWTSSGGGSKVLFLAGRNNHEINADGGTRMVDTSDPQQAKRTLKRLVTMMVIKRIMLGEIAEGYTGGKAMIIGNPETEKTDEVLKAFGEFLLTVPNFTTGTDLNMSERDMRIVKETAHQRIVGLSDEIPELGSAEETTAQGIVYAMRDNLEFQAKRAGFDGIKIAIQGIGNVGYPLTQMLLKLGARVFVYDINQKRRDFVRESITGEAANRLVVFDNEAQLYGVKNLDIFSPNAGDGTVDPSKFQKGKRGGITIIGAANSPLASFTEPERANIVDAELVTRGFEYVPDFVANLGGLLHSIEVQRGSTTREKMNADLERIIRCRLNQIREASRLRGVSLLTAAESIAIGEIISEGWI